MVTYLWQYTSLNMSFPEPSASWVTPDWFLLTFSVAAGVPLLGVGCVSGCVLALVSCFLGLPSRLIAVLW